MGGLESEEVVSVTSEGQVTIPKEFREELDIEIAGLVKFVRTADGDILVRPVTSLKDLRGILEGETDENGRTATEMLRGERAKDKARAEKLIEKYGNDDETDS